MAQWLHFIISRHCQSGRVSPGVVVVPVHRFQLDVFPSESGPHQKLCLSTAARQQLDFPPQRRGEFRGQRV